VDALLRTIGESPASLSGIIISHEHSDHMKGVGVLSKQFDIPVYANIETWRAMQSKKDIEKVASYNRRVFNTGEDFFIDNLNVLSFPIPHDAAEPVGYCLSYNGKKISIATDVGHLRRGWLDRLYGSDIVLIESNHDPEMLKDCSYPPWLKSRIGGANGHLANSDAANAVLRLAGDGVRHFVLGHMSHEANTPELARETVMKSASGDGIRVEIAYRDKIGGYYDI
jgi:phosphoribosyl 1,2-cyclic phosphodiesterase